MKKILDFLVSDKETLNENFVVLRLHTDESLGEINPGQFVELKVDHSPNTYLRRPFSINDVDYEKNDLLILIQRVGEGSNYLANLPIGATLNVLFPLGNQFSLPENAEEKLLLVGGGCGAAPLLFFGKKLRSLGFAPSFLIGARDAEHLLFVSQYRALGNLYITTENGDQGEKGYVTNHSCLEETWHRIYSCGPDGMMRAIAKYAKNNGVFCEVSLENTMACGIGACLCCVVDTVDGHKCACTEGPVFNINNLKWQI